MANHEAKMEGPKKGQKFVGFLWRFGLFLILFLTFFPFLFLIMTSFKDTHQFYHTFWTPSFPLHFENYTYAFSDMWVYFLNSLIVTFFSLAGIVVFGAVAGFVFARYDFPGKEPIFYGIIGMMMVPAVLMLIPSFMWVKQLGLLDTYWVMVFPYIAGGQILAIFLLRSFYSQIDNGLFEAAQMDGAGPFLQLWHVAFPLAKPVMGVVVIVSALAVWNNFLWPLVTTSSEDVMVITVGMMRYSSRTGGQYGRMFAGYVVSAIPLGILFLFCTRLFMKGITSGALKA